MKYKTEHPETLPPDYQKHLDTETISEKMRRLDCWMKDVLRKIMKKPAKPPF